MKRRLGLLLLAGWSATSLVAAPDPHRMPVAGDWKFALDPADRGLAEGWPDRGAVVLSDTIRLPGTTDLAKKGQHRIDAAPHAYYLTREWEHVGPAWYQRVVDIPAEWRGLRVELFLERVMWQSRVWVDGRDCGSADSLSTPHQHDLGVLTPGEHSIVVRVDNRMIHPIGDKSHGYGDQTQSRWNGIVGIMELRAKPPVNLGLVRVFPETDGGLRAEIEVRSHLGEDANCSLEVDLLGHGESEARWCAKSGEFQVAGGDIFRRTVKLQGPERLSRWSEFEPVIQQLEVRLFTGDDSPMDTRVVEFGLRDVGRAGPRIALDGRPLFLRGNLECAVFPQTGHPPVDVESWRRIWRIYQNHGLNHARFHSWCPPEAAFTAADEAGILLQVEAPVWMDGWMTRKNPRPEMDTEGYPQGPGRKDRSNDDFIQAEIRRILDTYGNHPSFVLFCIGNELGPANFDVIGRWMAEAKGHDPRRLYAASTARTITPYCEYNATHFVPGIGGVRQHLEAGTAWDYEKQYSRAPVPIIAHEVGQWPVYVDWDKELPKFTGPLKPYRLQECAQLARKNGVAGHAADLRAASGAVSRNLYRDEIESFLRTPSCAGFQLLGMQDFTGQGEALVGWLDAFYDSKGTTDPREFRHWCGPTVLLAKLPRYTWKNGETFTAEVLVHHSGAGDLRDFEIEWRIGNASGTFTAPVVGVGSVTSLGKIELPLRDVHHAEERVLALSRPGGNTELQNRYRFWVYPEPTRDDSGQVTVSTAWDQATKRVLARGGRVLLLAHGLGDAASARQGAWLPLYWSTPFFPGQSRDTLGLWVDSKHPALAGFPTAPFGDWQWWHICAGGRGFDLSGKVPAGWRPVVQPVSDFHFNRLLASVFECRVGDGRLLVSGHDLSEERARQHPEVAALRASLLRHMNGASFRPEWKPSADVLDTLFPPPKNLLQNLPDGFAKADLYVQAAAKAGAQGQSLPWQAAADNVLACVDGVRYRVEGDGIWKDADGSAWHGKRLKVVIQPRAGVPGTLHVRFHDWNRNGRTGTVTFEGGTRELGPHTDGVWWKFDVIREHTNDGELVLECMAATGPNIQITDLAFVPRETP